MAKKCLSREGARFMQPLRRFVRALSWLTFVALALTACSAPGAPPTPPTAQIVRETVEVQVTSEPQIVQQTVEVPVDVPADPGTLVVYSGRSEALVGPIIAQFSEATGIKVDVKYGSTAEIAATLLEEGANSPADIFFAQDPGGLGAIANANMFAPLPADLLSRVPARFQSPDG